MRERSEDFGPDAHGRFVCPSCGVPRGLDLTGAIELPADSRSDEITLQTVACTVCTFRGVAVYEESRRGALDSESWEHIGYYLDPASLAALSALIGSCPAPTDRSCGCSAHRQLGQTDEQGRWQGLERWGAHHSFLMALS